MAFEKPVGGFSPKFCGNSQFHGKVLLRPHLCWRRLELSPLHLQATSVAATKKQEALCCTTTLVTGGTLNPRHKTFVYNLLVMLRILRMHIDISIILVV